MLSAFLSMSAFGLDIDFDELESKTETRDTQAQAGTAMMFLLSDGVEKNEEEALHWLNKAGTQGSLFAQFMLSTAYENSWNGCRAGFRYGENVVSQNV